MIVLIWTYLLNVLLTKISVQFQEKNLELAEIGEWYVVLLLIVSEICNSPLTLIASCLAVMALSNGVIRMTSAYLNSCKSHAPPSTAVLSGINRKRVKRKTFSYQLLPQPFYYVSSKNLWFQLPLSLIKIYSFYQYIASQG